MIITPHKEKFIQENFIELSFSEDTSLADFDKFKKLNSADLYYLAENFNWDDEPIVLEWIINSKKCDKATASIIFWNADPSFYLSKNKVELKDDETKIYDLLMTIIHRFQKNDFKNSLFGFDPSTSGFDISEIEAGDILISIPQKLKESINGLKPLSISLIQERIWAYQLNRRLAKREKRKSRNKSLQKK